MQDVIDKIKDLYDVLEQKSKDIDARTVSLANQKKEIIRMVEQQEQLLLVANARQRELDKLEKKYKDIEDIVGMKSKVNSDRLEIAKAKKDIEKREKAVDKKEKDLEKIKEVFKTKNANMDALKKRLEAEKKSMRKDILDELKGKK
jgi:DNA repair ATPase RecN